MPLDRLVNDMIDKKSTIRAVVVFHGDDVGTLGARFSVQHSDFTSDPYTPLTKENVDAFLTSHKDSLSDNVIHKLLQLQSENVKKIGKQVMFAPSALKYNPKIRTAIIEANKFPPVIESESYERGETIFVSQSAVITTKPDGKSPPILGTYGAGPCIILSAYIPKTGETLLAHIDSPECAQRVFLELAKLTATGEKTANINLLGGDTSDPSRTNANLILDHIKSNRKFVLQGARLATDSSDALAIDSRTGKLLVTGAGMLNDGVDPNKLKHTGMKRKD
jgi:hypothetical protein